MLTDTHKVLPYPCRISSSPHIIFAANPLAAECIPLSNDGYPTFYTPDMYIYHAMAEDHLNNENRHETFFFDGPLYNGLTPETYRGKAKMDISQFNILHLMGATDTVHLWFHTKETTVRHKRAPSTKLYLHEVWSMVNTYLFNRTNGYLNDIRPGTVIAAMINRGFKPIKEKQPDGKIFIYFEVYRSDLTKVKKAVKDSYFQLESQMKQDRYNMLGQPAGLMWSL